MVIGEPQNRWSYILPLQVTGTAQQIFNTEVNLDIMEDYELVKNVFLTAIGDTLEQATITVVDSGKGLPWVLMMLMLLLWCLCFYAPLPQQKKTI